MTNKTRHLTTGKNEYIKSYITYDVDDRMEYVYEARANAAVGEPCLKTRYEYVTGTTRITRMIESEDTWPAEGEIS